MNLTLLLSMKCCAVLLLNCIFVCASTVLQFTHLRTIYFDGDYFVGAFFLLHSSIMR